MISFECDYAEGAHEEILRRLSETNREQLCGYGFDRYCESAKEKIRAACACSQADIYFLAGGTQTNAVVIRSLLKPYEGVVAADTGHVAVHEAGAIEFTGHKVLTIPQHQGKMDAAGLEAYLNDFYEDENREHMVFPGMVYLSWPTEYGTLYSKAELTAIYAVCQRFAIPLFIDGARLGYGLAAPENDVALPELAGLCDVFYIGGTKVGAFCGEAVVFPRNNAPKHFMTLVKQHGALMAKGRLLGVQFDTLFTDDLYVRIAAHAVGLAIKMKKEITGMGCELLLDSPTNQQFVIMENDKLEKLKQKIAFGFWEKVDDKRSAVRFCTSWATREEDVDSLLETLRSL